MLLNVLKIMKTETYTNTHTCGYTEGHNLTFVKVVHSQIICSMESEKSNRNHGIRKLKPHGTIQI
jgi:hypothetical protein